MSLRTTFATPFFQFRYTGIQRCARIGNSLGEVPRVVRGHDERSRLSYFKDGIKMLERIAYIQWEAFAGACHRNVVVFTPEWPVVKG